MIEGKPWQQNWIEAKPLDGGGQGDTFLVKHVSGHPDQAVLKLLKESKAQNPKARRRMYHEVANLRTLATAGANVPKVYDGNTEQFEELDQQLYFVMEYVGGETLDKLVGVTLGLPLTVSVNIALRLCETLKIAFKEGIQHRDIKPENLKVRDLGKEDVVMLDFGLSFNKAEETGVTEINETLDNKFISLPERRGPFEDKRDPRSDITSVSAILLYCLTAIVPRDLRDSQGRPPHRGSQAVSLIQAKVNNAAELSFLNSSLDKGLSYEIAERFQTVEELEMRLREILSPPSVPMGEDLITVADRERKLLFEVDEKTRLAEYKKRASDLENKLTDCINNYSRKLDPFMLFSEDTFQRLARKGKSPEVFSYTVFLKLKEHDVEHQITYRIKVESNECVVYRETIRVRLNTNPEHFGKPIIVHRYLTEQAPDSDYIIKDLIGAVKESMIGLREFVAKIQ